MKRLVWLSALLLAVSTGCDDSPVGPARGSFTSTLTFVEPADAAEPRTCCPTAGAGGPSSCSGACSDTTRCPASHCDENGRHQGALTASG